MEMTQAAAPAVWAAIPFAALLGAIALAPLFFADWWSKHYSKVSFGLAAAVILYYVGIHQSPKVVSTAGEYVSFICLIGSLFVVSGGIHIGVKGEATPLENTIFLLVGAVVANLFGTTGASMLLIRPWIRSNRYRITGHHIVFFIFVVSNAGGCLTPIGDPPLYIGYLMGVPFWWVASKCFPMWAAAVGVLLGMFYWVDSINYRKAPKAVRSEMAEHGEVWRFDGGINAFLLAAILGSVFLDHPRFLREAIMIGAAAASWFLTKKQIHESNHFTLHPVKEVAVLFAGIFATMMPALDLLESRARQAGPLSAGFFFWSSGALSSVLDNAPTYLCFLKSALGAVVDPALVAQVQTALHSHASVSTLADPVRSVLNVLETWHPAEASAGTVDEDTVRVACLLAHPSYSILIKAVSCGSVFFGANTYIGNGPNFMVKAIAEHAGVKTPAFLAYVWRFTLPFMLPMLVIVWLAFFL